VCGATSLAVSGRLCCTGQWTLDPADVCIKRIGNQIYVDLYLNCTSLCGCACEVADAEPLDIPGCPLGCGLYVLVVRVWTTYEGCACYPYNMFCQPIFCGMAMDSFKVCCDECGCYPCRCMFAWPCCGGPVNTD
jgi:hypothetical protein